jgi:gamma-glutamyl-gamma-aminobutyrate hydrolase PuuD
LRPGSAVAAAFAGSDQVEVLCRHSAYIATLGAGLEPSARASDETIEAFEAVSWPCIGAIWHAEWAGRNRAPDLSLFRWLASAARGKRK